MCDIIKTQSVFQVARKKAIEIEKLKEEIIKIYLLEIKKLIVAGKWDFIRREKT